MKCEIVKGFRNNSSKSFLTDSLYRDNENVLEYLNKIDHKCIDENLEFHDLRSLFEAVAPKLTAQDKEEIKKVLQTTDDANTIAAVLQSKLRKESLETESNHSYGGAFDIEDDQYFTKEEIVEFGNDVADTLSNVGYNKFDLSDVYVEGNKLQLTISATEDGIEESSIVPLDMRKIRKPQDLNRFHKVVVDELIRKFTEDGLQFNHSQREVYPLNESKVSALRDAIIDTCDWFDLMEIDFPRKEFLADSWADLRDGIEMGLDSELEVAEGLIDYLKGIVTFNSKLNKQLQDEHPFATEKELYDKLVRNYNMEVEKYNDIYKLNVNEELDKSCDENIKSLDNSIVTIEGVNYRINYNDRSPHSSFIDIYKEDRKNNEFQLYFWYPSYKSCSIDDIIDQIKLKIIEDERLSEINEDTVKTPKGKWVNRGKEGTHGTFRTKKEADAQRKAMFASGFKEGLEGKYEKSTILDGMHILLNSYDADGPDDYDVYIEFYEDRDYLDGKFVFYTTERLSDRKEGLLVHDIERYFEDTRFSENIRISLELIDRNEFEYTYEVHFHSHSNIERV